MLHLEIVTPERVTYIGETNSVVVPGIDGVMEILPKHMNLFAQLGEGEVKIKKDKEEIYLAIGGGFVEVTKDKVSVLVTRAVYADELNEEVIIKAQASAKEALSKAATAEERHAAQLIFRRSLVDLKLFRKISNRRAPPTH